LLRFFRSSQASRYRSQNRWWRQHLGKGFAQHVARGIDINDVIFELASSGDSGKTIDRDEKSDLEIDRLVLLL
jgi:hypothetical protein